MNSFNFFLFLTRITLNQAAYFFLFLLSFTHRILNRQLFLIHLNILVKEKWKKVFSITGLIADFSVKSNNKTKLSLTMVLIFKVTLQFALKNEQVITYLHFIRSIYHDRDLSYSYRYQVLGNLFELRLIGLHCALS